MAYVILEKTTGDPCGDGRIGLPFRWKVKESTFEIPLPDSDVVGFQFAELIPVTQNDINNFPNEIRIERTGTCNQCGFCCGWVNGKAQAHCCIHIIKTGGNKGKCGVYANLSSVCTTSGCGNRSKDGTHLECLPPPHQPYHKWNSLCGYTWTVTTPGLAITGKEVIGMYWAKNKSLAGRWIR